jgi:hypothetical protein
MIHRPRALWRALAASIVAGGLFAACASGSKVDDTPAGSGGSSGLGGYGGGGGAGQGGGTGIPFGQPGGPCNKTSDCSTGNCTEVGGLKVCTVACPPACPAGTYCALVEGDSLCVPDLKEECDSCKAPADCKSPSDACLKAPPGDSFCARDCTTMGECPSGFTCMDEAEYAVLGEAKEAGVPKDAGGGGAGQGGAGGAAGAGQATGGAAPGTGGAGQGAGGAVSHPSGQPWKFCVPEGGQSCGCSAQRDGIVHACQMTNAFGTCTGKETCDGAAGQWRGCDAKTPAAEACNGKDDDCDGVVDDGDPNQMCGGNGEPPPNTTGWGCIAGVCGAGPCQPGWTNYPPGAPKDGCACQMELGEPNDACATATKAGQVTDKAGSKVQMNGTLSSPSDVDTWTFDTVDTNEASNNSYHVSIAFTLPAQNDEFVFDVIRGDACLDSPVGPNTAITSYDWCVDGFDGTNQGEKGCGPEAAVHCTDHSSKYFVRVYRKAGAKGTCTPYQLTVTAAGGAACDFTQKCPPPSP